MRYLPLKSTIFIWNIVCFLTRSVVLTSITYEYFKKVFRKARKTSLAWSTLWTLLNLCEVSTKGGRNFTKVLFVALKDRQSSYDDNEGKSAPSNRESSYDDNEGKSALQTIAIELYKQPKEANKKRAPKISNKLY